MFGFFFAVALAFTDVNARTSYSEACRLVMNCTPRDAGTEGGLRAAMHLRNSLIRYGACATIHSFSAATPVGIREFRNVVAEWKGDAEDEWIVVVSHYDTKPFVKCPGANDGASTSGLLIGLAQAATACPSLDGNLMLMWLDGEESMYSYSSTDGLWGSKEAAKRLRESGRRVKAVICVDMLGDSKLKISMPRNTSSELRRLAIECAERTGHAGVVIEKNEYVKDDHVPFRAMGFNAIDLIDFEYGSAPGLNDYWHTPKDTTDRISSVSLATSGEILCEMINSLWKK